MHQRFFQLNYYYLYKQQLWVEAAGHSFDLDFGKVTKFEYFDIESIGNSLVYSLKYTKELFNKWNLAD